MSAFVSRIRNIEWHAPDGGFLGASILVALFILWGLMASGRPVRPQALILCLAAGQSFVCLIWLLQMLGISPRTRRGDVEDLHLTRR
jgi:hypothetical protein